MYEAPLSPSEEQERSETEKKEDILLTNDQLSEVFQPDNEAMGEIDRSLFIQSIRENTPGSEQIIVDLITKWESKVGESFSERVGHIRNIATLYKESGLFERAYNALNDAAEMAHQEGYDGIYDQLEQEMMDLKKEAGRE